MTLDANAAPAPTPGGEAALPAAAVARSNAALDLGYQVDPGRQGQAIGSLYGFKQDVARTVNAIHAAAGNPEPTPGAIAYHALNAKAGLQPGDPNFGLAIAQLTGLA